MSYSTRPRSSPEASGASSQATVRSNLATPASGSLTSTARPGSTPRCAGTFCIDIMTWNSGLRPASRGGRTAATTCSNGTSWCSWAPSVPARTRASSSAKVTRGVHWARTTTVLTKKPTRSSNSGRARPETGTPTLTSVTPAYRPMTSWNAASRSMNGVAPYARPTVPRRAAVAGRSRISNVSPAWRGSVGRGRSVGRSSAAGAPARWAVQ